MFYCVNIVLIQESFSFRLLFSCRPYPLSSTIAPFQNLLPQPLHIPPYAGINLLIRLVAYNSLRLVNILVSIAANNSNR